MRVEVHLHFTADQSLRADRIPDHSAFSRARNERFREGDVFRRVFERVVDANKQRSIAGQDWCRDRDPARSSRAVKEYLATLDDTAWDAASDVVPKFVFAKTYPTTSIRIISSGSIDGRPMDEYEVQVRHEARTDREQHRSSALDDLQEPRR